MTRCGTVQSFETYIHQCVSTIWTRDASDATHVIHHKDKDSVSHPTRLSLCAFLFCFYYENHVFLSTSLAEEKLIVVVRKHQELYDMKNFNYMKAKLKTSGILKYVYYVYLLNSKINNFYNFNTFYFRQALYHYSCWCS